MKRVVFSVLPLLLVLWTGAAGAQEALRIAAVVNDKMISVYDLNMRMSLVVAFSRLPDNAETRRRLAPQVLRMLIDDELKRQEARRLKIPVSESEIETALKRMEKRNRVDKGGMDGFLARRQIKKSSLIDQIEAEIGWSKVLGARYRPFIQIGDEEIDEVLAEIKKNKGKPEHLVFEIFLPVDRPENEAEIQTLANRLVQQIKSGTDFRSIARNFSKSPTAGRGGGLGWNRLGQLGQDLDNILVRLLPGQISDPVRTFDGFYILYLRDRRQARGVLGGEVQSPTVNLQQLFLPLPKSSTPAEVAQLMEAAEKLRRKAKTCEDLDKMGKDLESPLSGNLGDIKTNLLAPQQRMLVRGLPPLKVSQPLQTKAGIILLMVCKRQENKNPEMDLATQRSRIADRIYGERLGQMSRQHLSDLRRTAFVDIR